MLISRNPKLGFIHLPKTAGQFVAKWIATSINEHRLNVFNDPETVTLEVPYGAHTPVSHLPAQFSDTPMIAFVRNPLDWWESWYRYHRQFRDEASDDVYNLVGYPAIGKTFEEFVPAVFDIIESAAKRNWLMAEYMLEHDIGPLTWMFLHLCHRDILTSPKLAVNTVGKTETVKEDLINFLSQHQDLSKTMLNNILNAPRENITKWKKQKWTQENIDLVTHKERMIFENYYV